MPADVGTLSATLNNFVTVFSSGFSLLWPSIQWLIGTLLAIELLLIGAWWALGGNEQLGNVIRKILFLGFWLWIVVNFPTLAENMVFSLIDAGFIAGGRSVGEYHMLFDPSRIFGYGLLATEPLVQSLSDVGWNIGQAIIIGLGYILIIISFIIIAWQVAVAIIEFYLVMALAGILLPFGFIKATKFIAEPTIGYVIQSGIKLMVLSFIIAVVDPVLSGISFTSPDVIWNEIWSTFLTTGFIALLAWNAPGIAAGLASGSPSLTAGTVLQNSVAGAYLGSQAAAASLSATRAAARGGSAMAAGATQLAGNLSTGYARGSAYTQGGSASKMAGGVKGASESLVRSAYGSMAEPVKNAVKSNFEKGAASSYQGMTGSKPTGMGNKPPYSESNPMPAPDWARKMLEARSKLPQEAKPSGGRMNPKI